MHCKFLSDPHIIRAPAVSNTYYHMKTSHGVVAIQIRRNA